MEDSHLKKFREKMFAERYLISLSDTQAITSLALLIPLCLDSGCSISAYHYNIVCSLVLMSSAGHIASMVVIHRYFDTKVYLSVIRFLIIGGNFVLAAYVSSRRSNIFPSYVPLSNFGNHQQPFQHWSCLAFYVFHWPPRSFKHKHFPKLHCLTELDIE